MKRGKMKKRRTCAMDCFFGLFEINSIVIAELLSSLLNIV